MFTSIEQFEIFFDGHTKSTKKITATLTDESLSQRVAEGHWNLGRLMWHIVTTIPEMMKHTGLSIMAIDDKSPAPTSAAEIASAYDAVTTELSDQIKKNWTDESLQVVDEMYGEKWARGLTLHILVMHEIHHRGQLTVLMRQAGLKVPGLYGPALEEWVAYGMEAPK